MDGTDMVEIERGVAFRLNEVRGGMPVRRFAQRVGINAETARRYLDSGRVPAAVIAQVSRTFRVNSNWLLTGDGCRDPQAEVKRLLRNTATHDLLAEVGGRLDRATRQAQPGES